MRIVSAQQLLGRPLGAVTEKRRVGWVAGVIVEPDLGQAIGLLVRLDLLGWRAQVLDWRDMSDVDDYGVVTASADNLLDSAELVRAKELLDKNFDLWHLPVVTTDGVKLGWVNDFELWWETGDLQSITVKNWRRRPPLLIKKSAIARITLQEVVVRRAAARQKQYHTAVSCAGAG
jgi:sporulation protein YlmC with PRC-barrel domain